MRNALLFFITGVGLLTLSSCQKKTKQSVYKNANEDWVWGKKNLSPTFTWLKKHKEFESGHFKDSFYTYYNNYLKMGHVDSASYFIDWYSGQLNILMAYDSVMCHTQKTFISTHEKNTKPNVQYLLQAVAYHLSSQYQLKGDLDSAIFWSNYVINHPQTIPHIKAFSMTNVGELYIKQGKLDKALPLFINAAGFHNKLNNAIPESMNYALIAKTYCDLGAYDKATKYYDDAIAMMIKEGRRPNQVDYYYEKIKMLYYDVKDTTAVILTADSLAACMKPIFEKYFSKSKSYRFRINVGQYYKYECLNKPDSSNWYLQQSKYLADSLKNEELLTDYTILVMQHQLKYNKQITDENKLLEITAKQVAANSFSTAEVLYGFLAENAKYNKPTQALEYFKKQKEIQNKRLALNNNGKLFELVEKYETEKKEQQIVSQKEALKSKNKTIALLFAMLGFIACSALAYRYWQNRKKLKKEKQMTDTYTKQLLEKTEEERKRIATDLHDSISHELISLKNSNKEEFAQVNQKIDSIINDIRIISRNLHPILFEKVGLQNTIEQMVERVQSQNSFMLTADINYTNELPKATELQVYRIVQEGVTNIVKYAEAIAGKITITENANEVHIEIKDNGKGFDVNAVLNSDKAFGLHNIIERSRAIGGKATIVSTSSGTKIQINIPKPKL